MTRNLLFHKTILFARIALYALLFAIPDEALHPRFQAWRAALQSPQVDEFVAAKANASCATRSCCSDVSCGNIGNDTISAATRDAAGKSSGL
jgi:hypothetical protein